MIILSQENKSHLNQFTTASVLIQQIPTNDQFENKIRITTPLSVKRFQNEEKDNVEVPQTLALKSYQSMREEPTLYIRNHNIYPNHRYDVRRQVEEIYQPRPFDYIMRGTPPTAFQVTHKNSSNFPQIPKDYVGNVNSIQDILRQVGDAKLNNFQEPNGMHKIKIAGTYKHRKVDDVTRMFEPGPRKNRGQNIDHSLLQSHSENSHNVIKDPFYKFKPNPLSDVNLMATNQFRFAPYSVLSNKVPMDSSQSMDPANLYHQIITANKNRLKYLDNNSKNDNIQSKQKPFTLMLDVYPMPDEETSSTVAYSLPVKYQNHVNSNVMRHPGISSINNIQPFFHNANYPQHKPHHYPNIPHYHNDIYFRKFAAKQLNSRYYRPVENENNANNPSQITVHLNLFPKKKDRSETTQKSDQLNKDESVFSEKNNLNSISVRLQERMAKLNNNVNQTEDHKHISGEELKDFVKVSNKVDMDVFKNTTESNIKDNVIMIDDTPENVDSSEEIFSREFLQFQTVASPTESFDATTLEPLSVDHSRHYSISTILPIEPRGYSRKLDTSFFKTE